MKSLFYLFFLIMIVALSCTVDSTNPDTPGLNDYGVLRIEVWEGGNRSEIWYIYIDDEYIGIPLYATYYSGGVVVPGIYEKSVIVGNHTISGYRDDVITVDMTPQTVYVSSQGLTFLPSLLWE